MKRSVESKETFIHFKMDRTNFNQVKTKNLIGPPVKSKGAVTFTFSSLLTIEGGRCRGLSASKGAAHFTCVVRLPHVERQYHVVRQLCVVITIKVTN